MVMIESHKYAGVYSASFLVLRTLTDLCQLRWFPTDVRRLTKDRIQPSETRQVSSEHLLLS